MTNTSAVRQVKRTAVYVYEAPVRIWHWVNALSITVLAVTGWFIANPLPTMPGEASDHFVMGYMRFFRFAAGYIFAVGFVLWADEGFGVRAVEEMARRYRFGPNVLLLDGGTQGIYLVDSVRAAVAMADAGGG